MEEEEDPRPKRFANGLRRVATGTCGEVDGDGGTTRLLPRGGSGGGADGSAFRAGQGSDDAYFGIENDGNGDD